MGYINHLGEYVPNPMMKVRLPQQASLMDLGYINEQGVYVGNQMMKQRPFAPTPFDTVSLDLQELRMRPPTEEEKADPNSLYNNCKFNCHTGWVCPEGFVRPTKTVTRKPKALYALI